MSAIVHASLKEAVEAFLYEEADLLDNWQLKDWLELLTDDAQYLIPPIGVPGAENLSPKGTMFVMADGRSMIEARVTRLLGRAAFAEQPRSGLRRTISNVRLVAQDGAEITVASNTVIYRIRRAEITQFIGRYLHKLVRDGDSFLIREKRVMLDIDVLRGQGGISVIL